MGDVSAEPSMEEILSSIKRIIAEEGEGPPQRARRPQRAPAPPQLDRTADSEEVLELSEPMLQRRSLPPEHVAPSPTTMTAAQPVPASEPILSQQAAAASRGSLDALTRLVDKPEQAPSSPPSDNALEGLVREMLRPMLRDWLDANLPGIVETMVSREIERITGSR